MDDFIDDSELPENDTDMNLKDDQVLQEDNQSKNENEDEIIDDNNEENDDIVRYSLDLTKNGPLFDFWDYEDYVEDNEPNYDIDSNMDDDDDDNDEEDKIIDNENNEDNNSNNDSTSVHLNNDTGNNKEVILINENDGNTNHLISTEFAKKNNYSNARSHLEKVIRSLEKRVANECLMKDDNDAEWYKVDGNLIDDTELDKMKKNTKRDINPTSALDLSQFVIKKYSTVSNNNPSSVDKIVDQDITINDSTLTEKETQVQPKDIKTKKKGELSLLSSNELELARQWKPPAEGISLLDNLQDIVNILHSESCKFAIWSKELDMPLAKLDYVVRKANSTRPTGFMARLLTIIPFSLATLRTQLRRIQRSQNLTYTYYQFIHHFHSLKTSIPISLSKESNLIAIQDLCINEVAFLLYIYERFIAAIVEYNKSVAASFIIDIADQNNVKKFLIDNIVHLFPMLHKDTIPIEKLINSCLETHSDLFKDHYNSLDISLYESEFLKTKNNYFDAFITLHTYSRIIAHLTNTQEDLDYLFLSDTDVKTKPVLNNKKIDLKDVSSYTSFTSLPEGSTKESKAVNNINLSNIESGNTNTNKESTSESPHKESRKKRKLEENKDDEDLPINILMTKNKKSSHRNSVNLPSDRQPRKTIKMPMMGLVFDKPPVFNLNDFKAIK